MLRPAYRLKFSRLVGIALLVGCAGTTGQWTPAFAQVHDYVVGANDVLTITFWDQPNMSGKYTVEPDGTFTFPLLGRVQAAGVRIQGLEGELKRRLALGYFKNPQLSVAVEQYRSQRIFIVGEVRNPGTYPLNGSMTLIEALAHAGSLTADASSEAVIVRPRPAEPGAVPAPDDEGAGIVLRADLKRLAKGALGENIPLRDGDTVFISRVEQAFVLGQVKSPGAYPVRKDMTILQLLAMAGGVTDRGSTGRVRVARIINGKHVEKKIRLEDPVQPGDTIIVLERII